MAPNPIMLPKGRTRQSRHSLGVTEDIDTETLGLTWPLITSACVVLLLALSNWAFRWVLSGCAIETLVILFGAGYGSRLFPAVPLWTVLTTLNLFYAVASTSWLLYGVFATICWPLIGITCLFQFQFVADLARRNLRTILRDLHFTRDRIALFNLPALEIDTEVSGLLVIRGVTISFADLTLVAHGIEVGIKLTDDIELALHADEVRVPFFRRIEIGDVYANVKGGQAEMTFADVEEELAAEDDFFANTPLLRAATTGSNSLKDRPNLRDSLTGGSFLKDSSAKAGLQSIKTLSPDDQKAEQQYHDILTEIRTTSAVYQSRARARRAAKAKGTKLEDEKDLRAAAAAELHEFPSVPHPPSRSVKVTTLRSMTSPKMKRLQHRLPFLLRLLLGPLGYFHPVTIRSINAAGSGKWIRELLSQHVFKHYAANNAEVRRLKIRILTWLADAYFCLQLTELDGLGQVPISTSFDIVAYLHMADIIAYRTLPEDGVFSRVVRLGGADATFTIPIFLLPHHEHILPPRPTVQDKKMMVENVHKADGTPKTVQAEKDLERVQKDETAITMSVHASLPASLDQSLLTFAAALVKATKIIEFDKEGQTQTNGTDSGASTPTHRPSVSAAGTSPAHARSPSPTKQPPRRVQTLDETNVGLSPLHKRVQSDLTAADPTNSNTGNLSRSSSVSSTNHRFKSTLRSESPDKSHSPSASTSSLAGKSSPFRNLNLNLSSSTSRAGDSIRDFVKDVQQSTRDGMKKTLVGGVGSMVNDRWIAKMVGKIAANLEKAQGDVGYSGAIPVPLEPYRPQPGGDGELSKFLP